MTRARFRAFKCRLGLHRSNGHAWMPQCRDCRRHLVATTITLDVRPIQAVLFVRESGIYDASGHQVVPGPIRLNYPPLAARITGLIEP